MPHLSPLSWVLTAGVVVFSCMVMIIFTWWARTVTFSFNFEGVSSGGEEAWRWEF